LKQQLSSTSQRLQASESEVHSLQQQLNETNVKVAQLQANVTRLQQQITNETAQIEKLQQELKLKNYTTVGLSFLWNPALTADINVTYLRQVVDLMDQKIWDPLHIYFFIYAAQPKQFVPRTENCAHFESDWRNDALSLYPSEVPVGVFEDLGVIPSGYEAGGVALGGQPYAACSCVTGTNCADSGVISLILYEYVGGDAVNLSHELLHVIGRITDDQIYSIPISDEVIPRIWYAQLQAGAKQYETPIPADYQFP
jgi:hypothetical protein